MSVRRLIHDRRGHVSKILTDLVRTGWKIERFPADARIPDNGLLIILRYKQQEIRLRVFVYKVTTSGRNRPHERRVEITSTYQSGVKRTRTFSDVVLGIDVPSQKFVGIDSRRLELGGPTHNASSFFDLEGLNVDRDELRLSPRAVANRQFRNGTELHAFFGRVRLAEYLFNHKEIHTGAYQYDGVCSGKARSRRTNLPTTVPLKKAYGSAFVLYRGEESIKRSPNPRVIEAIEEGDSSRLRKRKISQEQLKRILAVCDEIGNLGEQEVLRRERQRLTRLGFVRKAKQVTRISLTSVGEGYDIVSFEDDGVTKRYIEVKTTIGSGMLIDMSRGEWRAAQSHRRHYYLARVTSARSSPQVRYVRDPVQLERRGLISRTPSGWKINLGAI